MGVSIINWQGEDILTSRATHLRPTQAMGENGTCRDVVSERGCHCQRTKLIRLKINRHMTVDASVEYSCKQLDLQSKRVCHASAGNCTTANTLLVKPHLGKHGILPKPTPCRSDVAYCEKRFDAFTSQDVLLHTDEMRLLGDLKTHFQTEGFCAVRKYLLRRKHAAT